MTMTSDKILILTANPRGTAKLRLDEEVRDIKEGLRQAKERDRFIIESEWAVRPRDIRRAILHSKPQVIHFSGHGSEDGGLAFENEVGQVQLLHPEALSGLFDLFSEYVKCVLLNACYSEIQADAIVQHVDFVIGMNREIGDRAAIEFSVGFYDALGAGYSVEIAYKFGCNAIQMAGIAEHSTPVLKSKNNLPTTLDTKSSSLENPRPEDPITRSLNLELSSRVVYAFVVSGSIDEVSKQKLEVVVAHLREITGDTSLTLLKIESGSIRLVVKGSPEGFRKLKSLVESGQLTEILDMSVQGVKLEEGSLPHTYSEVYQQSPEAPNSKALENLGSSEPAEAVSSSTGSLNRNEDDKTESNLLLTRQNFLRIIGAGILGVAAAIIAFVEGLPGTAFYSLRFSNEELRNDTLCRNFNR
jgi:hypothetical protein